MTTAIYQLSEQSWTIHSASQAIDEKEVQLVLCFASKAKLMKPGIFTTLRERFPAAQIAICSTAGEIYQDAVMDDSVIITAIQFEKTKIASRSVDIKNFDNTYTASIALAKELPKDDLRYILVLSDGSKVNGSDLVKGLTSQVKKDVLITGGLAGDGPDFQSTLVGLNTDPSEGQIIAIGLYGNHIKVTHGSEGGWDIFGLEKRVTNSSANILVELENQNALDLYKKYLGPESEKLPGSALLFPLSVIIPGAQEPVVRTILSVNEEDKTMTFAGDIPVGSRVRFMKANFDRLTYAAAEAAEYTVDETRLPDFSLLISCVGRKLILGEKTNEEVKAVSKIYNDSTPLSGFYSYGEISPFNEGDNCQLHNQTMTITSFYEK